jgi:hypothetical protein
MRETTKEFVKLTAVLVVVFLLLAHYKGAVAVIGAGTRGWGGLIRDFQGRGHY